VSVLFQIAEGLGFAHDQGVVHRDVKPSNVMLLNDGSAKILDFGIARFMDSARTRHTTPGFILGTIEYMSPDQLQGVDADPLTDIFSFGVVCYELLSGHQPFRAPTVSRIVYLLTAVDPAPLCQVVPGCPEALHDVACAALAKDRLKRYQSMQELLFDLAPIETALRRARAMDLATEAGRLIENGDFTNAQSSLNRALGLDPACEKGQELRREIQRRRERRELLRQAEALVGAGEENMAARRLDAAVEAFESALRMIPADAGPVRADVERRLFAASQSRETARRLAALFAEAQEAAGRGDLPAAHRLAAEAAALDPTSAGAASLAQQLAAEIERREAEEERQHQERRRRQETISSVTQAVRGHVNAKRYAEALRLVEDALSHYPEDEILQRVRAAALEARRRYAEELEAGRQQMIEQQRQAAERLRLLDAERAKELLAQRPAPAPAAEGTARTPSIQEAGDGAPEPQGAPGRSNPERPPSSARAPLATPLPSSSTLTRNRTPALPARRVPRPRTASLRSRFGRRTVILSAAGLIALVLGFGLSPLWRSAHTLQGSTEAQRPRSSSSNPKQAADSDIAERRKQIEDAKQVELAALHGTIARAIATRQWPPAGAGIARFEQLAPGDPRPTQWRNQVEDGMAADQEIGALRSSIPNTIRAKDWAKAESQIASLLERAPTDPEGLRWRKLVVDGRKSDSPPIGKKQQGAPIGKVPADPAANVASAPVAPVIVQFAAEPTSVQRGQPSTLRWQVTGATTDVFINMGIAGKSARPIRPPTP
jgi:tetratricopeptide (TPR) repeat protein